MCTCVFVCVCVCTLVRVCFYVLFSHTCVSGAYVLPFFFFPSITFSCLATVFMLRSFPPLIESASGYSAHIPQLSFLPESPASFCFPRSSALTWILLIPHILASPVDALCSRRSHVLRVCVFGFLWSDKLVQMQIKKILRCFHTKQVCLKSISE